MSDDRRSIPSIWELATFKGKVDFSKCSFEDDYWQSVRLLVNKFIKKYRKIIPSCLSKEDFLQEAWLAKNGYTDRYPWQACLKLMNYNSLYSSHELSQNKTRPLEKRFLDHKFLTYTTVLEAKNTINVFIEQEYVDKKLASVGGKFKKIVSLYFEGYETKEIARKIGLSESRVRHIRVEGMNSLKEEISEENKESLKLRYVTCRHGKIVASGGKKDSGKRKNFFS